MSLKSWAVDLMRDRLIELLKRIDYVFDDNPKLVGNASEYVADYLLANGGIVPPCKVGDTVYFAGVDSGECLDGTLVSYCLDAAHLWFNCHYTCGLNYWHPIEDFGTKVFLTREEAERALKGEQG